MFYIVSLFLQNMSENAKNNGSSVPGTDWPKEPPSLQVIESGLERDLATAGALIEAMLADRSMIKQMALWVQGRYLNHLNTLNGSASGAQGKPVNE